MRVSRGATAPHACRPEACGPRHAHSPVLLLSSRSSVRVGTGGLGPGGGGSGAGGAGARLFFFCSSIWDPRDTCEARRRSVRAGGAVGEWVHVGAACRSLGGRVP